MKLILPALIALLSAQLLTAQPQPELLTGGWSTSNSNRFTRITGTSNLDSKVYRIDCTMMVDTSVLQFNIIVDGITIPASFFEGSYVVVEGKNIAIQQANPGKMVKGTWKVIQVPEIPPVSVQWAGYPKINKDILIAALKTEQEFVVSINYTSLNCSNTTMTVYIDGTPVKDNNNNILTFWEGSSIYGKGKNIVIRVAGSCAGNNDPVYGDLKLKK